MKKEFFFHFQVFPSLQRAINLRVLLNTNRHRISCVGVIVIDIGLDSGSGMENLQRKEKKNRMKKNRVASYINCKSNNMERAAQNNPVYDDLHAAQLG